MWDAFRMSLDDLKNFVQRADLHNVQLKKEIMLSVLGYDTTAVRVEVQSKPIALIPYEDSPVINYLIDLASDGVLSIDGFLDYSITNDAVFLYLNFTVNTSDAVVHQMLKTRLKFANETVTA